jgi:hypothetical protein
MDVECWRWRRRRQQNLNCEEELADSDCGVVSSRHLHLHLPRGRMVVYGIHRGPGGSSAACSVQQQVRSGSSACSSIAHDLGLLPSFFSVTRGHEGSLRTGNIRSLSARLRPILRLLAIHRTTQCVLGFKTSISCCRRFLAVPPTHAGDERGRTPANANARNNPSPSTQNSVGKSTCRYQKYRSFRIQG